MCFQGYVSRKLVLAVRLIFIYCGAGKRSCVPSGWATENPQVSSEKSPTDLSNRQRDPANGWVAKPVEGVWYFLDHRQSLCNTRETQRNDWDWGTEPTTSLLERVLFLCANTTLTQQSRTFTHPATVSGYSFSHVTVPYRSFYTSKPLNKKITRKHHLTYWKSRHFIQPTHFSTRLTSICFTKPLRIRQNNGIFKDATVKTEISQ